MKHTTLLMRQRKQSLNTVFPRKSGFSAEKIKAATSYFFIFTFILTKLEFGFHKSHIYGLFTPVKSTSQNKYN